MSGTLDLLAIKKVAQDIQEAIYHTESNSELAYLGSFLLLRSLDIMSTVSPPGALRKAILTALRERKQNLILEQD